MRFFVKLSVKRDRVCAFILFIISKIRVDILIHISEELNVKRNIFNFTETYLEYKIIHLEIIARVYENKFNNYRDIDEEEMENYVNEKLSIFLFIKYKNEYN